MTNSLLRSALILLSFAFLQVAGVSKTAAAPPSEQYTLVWADEFDGDTLDLKKWGYRNLGPRRLAVNVKDCVSLDGKGNLLLTTRRNGDRIETAMIGTAGRFEPTYGYFECRVEFQDQPGQWSAFWLQSPTIGKVGDPRVNGTEIDIFEYLVRYPTKMHHNLHWDGYGEAHKNEGMRPVIEDLADGFHTIGLLWTPDEYVFYVDGKETWRTKTAVSRRSQYIILSMEVDKWGGSIDDARLPDAVRFDYVRVYQKKNED